MRLKKLEIDAATCPPGRRDALFFDDELPGFALRVTEKGVKTFLFQYRRGRQVHRLVLGRYGPLTPKQARDLAAVARGEVAAGRNPAGDRKAAINAENEAATALRQQRLSDAFTLETLVQKWETSGLAGRSAVHRKEAPRAMRDNLAKLIDRSAASITPAEAQRAIDAVAFGTGAAKPRPVMARRTRDYARAAFNWAIGRRLVTANPFAAVQIETREISRDRVLSDAELGDAWRAAVAQPYPFGPLVRLLILTLQRRQEVAAMRWSELGDDGTFAIWTLPATRAKNRKQHVVHLAEPARVILRELRRDHGKHALVFTTTRAKGKNPPSGFTHARQQLARRIADAAKDAESPGAAPKPAPDTDLQDWRLHDFRRTGVTIMARLGVAPHVSDRVLNHVAGDRRGVAAVYQRFEFLAERQAALKLWAEHVLKVGAEPIKAKPGSNVVRLPIRK